MTARAVHKQGAETFSWLPWAVWPTAKRRLFVTARLTFELIVISISHHGVL